MTSEEVHFYNIDREEIQKEMTEIKWDAESAEKGGYEHFMLKEIHEQPKAVQDTRGAYIKDGAIDFSEAGLTDEQLKSIERIYVAACGSAYHVGVVGKYVTESLAGIPAEVDLASEFRYRNPILAPNSALIVVSQSGETADSLAALRLAKDKRNSGYRDRQCGRLKHCKRKRSCLIHICRPRDLGCDDKGVQRTVGGNVPSRRTDGKSKRQNR